MPAAPATALEIAADVASGTRSARDLRAEALAAVRAAGEPADGARADAEAASPVAQRPLNAFAWLLDGADDDAARAAAAVDGKSAAERAALPLAGVPFAVKSNVTLDSPTIRRLLSAGAVPIGFTTTPEFCVWGATDSAAYGIARNPWNRSLTPGGSSGGSAAAVAAGWVPFAHGNDGMGSLRIPAACCGLVTLKPGHGVVPTELGAENWGGMSEDGLLATTVSDLATGTAVLAGRPQLATRTEHARLRIAMALNSPVRIAGRKMVSTDRRILSAVRATADALRAAGHEVVETPIPYPKAPWPLLARWTGGLDADAAEANFPVSRMERRNRYHALLGRMLRGIDTYDAQQKARDEMHGYMDSRGDGRDGAPFDVVLTPTLAAAPLPAEAWYERSWLRSLWANLRFAPFPSLFNHIAWPAMSVPAGDARIDGAPVGVQLAGRPGSEGLLLDVAAQLEQLRPWTRTAPSTPAAPPAARA